MQQPLGDVPIPNDYPFDLHQQLVGLARQLFEAQNAPEPIGRDFGAGLRSVEYRFMTFVESGEAFQASLEAHGDAPAGSYRYLQEREFFSFITTGGACVEALSYALFSIGAALDLSTFPFGSESQRRGVTPLRTIRRYRSFYNGSNVANSLAGLVDSDEYTQLRQVRSVLFHRGLPGRIFSVSVGSNTEPPRSRYHDFGDQPGPEIHADTFRRLRGWLGSGIANVFAAAVDLIERELPPSESNATDRT